MNDKEVVWKVEMCVVIIEVEMKINEDVKKKFVDFDVRYIEVIA